eukprot:1752583-Rhodomonas_salina.1
MTEHWSGAPCATASAETADSCRAVRMLVYCWAVKASKRITLPFQMEERAVSKSTVPMCLSAELGDMTCVNWGSA